MSKKRDKATSPPTKWPDASDYEAAIDAALGLGPDTNAGLTQGLRFERDDSLGLAMISGGAGLVLHAFDEERQFAFKVFVKEAPRRDRRYREIHQHLARAASSVFVDFQFAPRGIFVTTESGDAGWYPALRMEWCEGDTLDVALDEALERGYDAQSWIRSWLTLLEELRRTHTAHGDLHDGNVIVSSDGTMRLIDYDGMFVPSMRGALTAAETGHPAYQHPGRDRNTSWFDEHIDGVSALVILTTLAGLTPDLWAQRDHEGLLLGSADLESPQQSPMLRHLSRAYEPAPQLVELLRDALASPCGECVQIDEAARICGVELTAANGAGPTTEQQGVGDFEFDIEDGYDLLDWEPAAEPAPPATPSRPRKPAARGRAKRAPAAKPAPRVRPRRSAAASGTRAASLESRGDSERAEVAYDAALERDPGRLDALVRRGRVRLRRGAAAEAVADFTSALELEPANHDALLGRAAAQRALGDLKASLADCDRADRVAKPSARSFVERGWTNLSFKTGRRNDAAAAFDRATRLDRNSAEAYAGRGIARLLRGDRKEAKVALERALLLDPQLAEAQAGSGALGIIERKRGAAKQLASASKRARETQVMEYVAAYAKNAKKVALPDAPKPRRPVSVTPRRLPAPSPGYSELLSRHFQPSLPATASPLAAVDGSGFLSRRHKREITRRIFPTDPGRFEQFVWLGSWAGLAEPDGRRALLVTTQRLIWTQPRAVMGMRWSTEMPGMDVTAELPATDVWQATRTKHGVIVLFTNEHKPLSVVSVTSAVDRTGEVSGDRLASLASAIESVKGIHGPRLLPHRFPG